MKEIEVYIAKFYKDNSLSSIPREKDWMIPIQVGAALTQERVAQVTDDTGENISSRNMNYSELTAFYWIWKNRICRNPDPDKYYGLFHYRRWLDIEDKLDRIREQDVDVILPMPMFHAPDIKEHHTRYISERDWDFVLRALEELQPDYFQAYDGIFSQELFYNYNILVGKAVVIKEYCQWLFPILFRVEELALEENPQRADRFIGYIGENLLTLYFMYHKDRLKIVSTGKKFFT